MPSMLISNIAAAVAGGAVTNIQPPAGQGWLIYELAADPAFVGAQPDLAYGIADGVLTLANIVIDPFTAPLKGARSKEIYITNANYLQVTNTAAGAANVGWTGERVNVNNIITDMVTVPNGGNADIRPPAGQTWRLTEIGSELQGAANNPACTFGITDGVLVASIIIRQTDVRGQEKALDWIIDNTIYLRLTNTGGADCDIAYCGVRVPLTSIGSIQDVAGGATLDIQPPATQEWVITEIAAETWAGVAPNGYPDIIVSLYDAAVLSDILEPGAASLGWNRKLHLHIDNATYLRITENSAGANEVGLLGYLKRAYS